MFDALPALSEETALSWAAAALAHFPVVNPQVCLIAHSENMTFRVDEAGSGRGFLLRLHIPHHEYLRGVRQMSLAIQSELSWLEALAGDTGLPLQQPQPTREGGLVAHVDLPDRQSAPATLLTWLDGAPFQLAAPQADALVEDLGRLLARLHNHTEHWPTPSAFIRPHYETAYLDQIAQELVGGVYAGLVAESDYLVFERCLSILSEQLNSLGKDSRHWGLIHNDLHPGNCLVVDGQVLPIDFSLCGFGYYLFDIGTTLGSLPPNFRSHMLSGYRELRPLPEDSLRMVEASLIASRLSYYTFILHDPTQQDWLRARLVRTAADLCRPHLAGESFLLKVR